MKILELTADENGIHFLRVNPHPLSAGQKFTIIMSLIGTASFIGFFALMVLF